MQHRVAPVMTVMLLIACSGQQVPPHDVNAIVVLVDTLRADHLGAYGYARATSPNIDRFARESLLFTQARAQAPCTHPSVASMLTAVQPMRLGRVPIFGFGIPRRFPSIATILRKQGFQTAAVSASPIVRKTPSRRNPAGGYGGGFDQFHEDCLDRDANCVNAEALRLLDTLEEPFFLYLHYMDPHDPYRPPDAYERRFAGSHAGPDFIVAGDPAPIAAMHYADAPQVKLTDADWRHLVDLYDDEIRFFDARFGELLRALDQRGLAERTLVALTADHGEAFLEHGDVMHCRSLQDVQVHTPLIVRAAGAAPRRIAKPVGNVDLVPTLLDYLQVDTTGLHFDGRSLRETAASTAQPALPVFGAWRGEAYITHGGFKLIVDLKTGRQRLFDLVADPAETRAVNVERPEQVQRLGTLLAEHRRALGDNQPGGTDSDERLMQRLRDLGYLK